MNIHEKIAEVRKLAAVLQKNKSSYTSKYVSGDEITLRIQAGMDKYRLNVYINIVPESVKLTPHSYEKVKPVKGGGEPIRETVNEYIVTGDLIYTWVNLDNPEEVVESRWFLAGQQTDASQAVGSALTYMNRYYLLKFFQIATPEDDPENWIMRKYEVENADDIKDAQIIVNSIHQLVTDYLNGLTDDNLKKARTKLTTLVKKYARDSEGKPSPDYFNIKDSDTANKLLDEVKAMTNGGDKK